MYTFEELKKQVISLNFSQFQEIESLNEDVKEIKLQKQNELHKDGKISKLEKERLECGGAIWSKSGSSAMAAMTLLKICSSWSEMDTIKSFPILRVSPSYIFIFSVR